jgi:TolB protein
VASGGKTFITRNPIGRYDNHPSVRNGIIACDTYINGERQIVTLRDNGTEITVLGPGSYPSWHPTENKLVFIRDTGVWEMDTETTQQTQLYARSEKDTKDKVNVTSPVYSGDGKYIVFVKSVKIGPSYYWHLFRIDADGNNLTELTQGSISTFSPAYGAGNQIFFIANAGGKYEIWSALISEE